MSMRFVKYLAPVALVFAAGPVSAQHGGHGGGHAGGGHAGGGYHGVGAYHGGGYHGGAYHSGYGGYRGGYYGGARGYRGYGYGGYGGYGYGLGYGGIGYGLGYGGIGYGGYGYGLGYSSGYYSPSYGSYSYPLNYSYDTTTYPYSNSIVSDGNIVQSTSGYTPSVSAVAAPATLTVTVPSDAQVWFDGKEASGSGTSRVFTSPVLQPGQSSVLSIKARWNGSDRTMQLPITAGDNMSVDLRDSQ